MLQAWLLIGAPALVVGLGLFVVRSPVRSLLGYVVLAGGFAGMALTHRVSGAVFGGLLALLYAAGRGGDMERERPDAGTVGVPEVVGYKRRRASG